MIVLGLSYLHSMKDAKKKLNKALFEPMKALLDAAHDSTWPAIRSLLQRETKTALSDFASAIFSFDFDQKIVQILLAKLEEYGSSIIVSMERDAASRALMRMKDRFLTVGKCFSRSKLRFWTRKESVKVNIEKAQLEDSVENTLRLALLDVPNDSVRSIQSVDPLTSNTWEDVPPIRTIITPTHCKLLWLQFKDEIEFIIKQDISNQIRGMSLERRWSTLILANYI